MKRFRVALIVLFVLSAFASCAGAAEPSGTEPQKLLVVATLFPQYDFARQIAGDRATVVMLLPPGAEAHTFDPRPGDIRTLNQADLFIYTGKVMEPWAKRIVDSLDNKKLQVVDASKGIALYKTEDEGDHDHHGGHEEEYDPHIWLDPTNAMKMVDTIADALCEKDPANAEAYRANAAKYDAEIKRLDDGLAEALKEAGKSGSNTLAFGGPFAYFYFLDHYRLNYVTAYDSCSTEGEPGVRRIADVIRAVKEKGLHFILYDPLENSKVARSIADETGAKLLPFSTMHNVTKEEFESGITYRDLLVGDIRTVMTALGLDPASIAF